MVQQRLEEVTLSSKGSCGITGEKKRRWARGEHFSERWNSRWPFPRIHLSLLHSVELPGSPAAPPDGVNINVDTADMNYLPDMCTTQSQAESKLLFAAAKVHGAVQTHILSGLEFFAILT